jgi:hypothetical protein
LPAEQGPFKRTNTLSLFTVVLPLCVSIRNRRNGIVRVVQRRNDLLWLAIVGVTDHLVEDRLDSGRYTDLAASLQSHVAYLNDRDGQDARGGGPAGVC